MGRFKEPSTYAGISAALAAIAPFLVFSPEAQWIVGGAAAFFGGIAVWVREKPAK